jgi:cardiolipin synthase
MLHAKTAVADGRWARVGSSNLNMASWLGNWELDVAVENAEFARQMEEMYLKDLENATEIVLGDKNRVRPVEAPAGTAGAGSGHDRRQRPRRSGGSASRLTASAIRVGNTVGAAITSRLVLGAAEAKVMTSGGIVLIALAIMALLQPLLLVIPFSLIAGWIGISLLMKARALRNTGMKRRLSDRQAYGEEDSLLRENRHGISPGGDHEPAGAKNGESAREFSVGSAGPAGLPDSAGPGASAGETPHEKNDEPLPEPVHERKKAAAAAGSQ